MANEILIVDDNPDIRNILNELISDLRIQNKDSSKLSTSTR